MISLSTRKILHFREIASVKVVRHKVARHQEIISCCLRVVDKVWSRSVATTGPCLRQCSGGKSQGYISRTAHASKSRSVGQPVLWWEMREPRFPGLTKKQLHVDIGPRVEGRDYSVRGQVPEAHGFIEPDRRFKDMVCFQIEPSRTAGSACFDDGLQQLASNAIPWQAGVTAIFATSNSSSLIRRRAQQPTHRSSITAKNILPPELRIVPFGSERMVASFGSTRK